MSEVSHQAEWSALEMTITNKFGAGHGTSVLLGLLKKLHDGQAVLEPLVVEIVPGPYPAEAVLEPLVVEIVPGPYPAEAVPSATPVEVVESTP